MSEEKNKKVKLSFTDTWETYIKLPKEVYEKEYEEKIQNTSGYDLKELIKEMQLKSEGQFEQWEHTEPYFHGVSED